MIKRFFINILLTSLAAIFAAYILPGVHIDGMITAIVVAIVLAILNSFVRPVLVLLTLPVTVFTLGLFLLVINIIIIKWAASLVDGFEVEGWLSALLFSLVVSIVTSIMAALAGDDKS